MDSSSLDQNKQYQEGWATGVYFPDKFAIYDKLSASMKSTFFCDKEALCYFCVDFQSVKGTCSWCAHTGQYFSGT